MKMLLRPYIMYRIFVSCNNYIMIRKIDFIALRVTIFFILIAWCVYLFNSFWWGLIIGIALFILLSYLYSFYEKSRRPYSYNQLAFYMAINDNPIAIIAGLLPPDINYVQDKNTLIIQDKELIYASFTFSPFSMGDMVKAINSAKDKGCNILTVVTSETDSKIYNVVSKVNIDVNIINIKALMKLMLKSNNLPDLRHQPKIKIRLRDVLNRQVGGRLMFTSAIIAMMSVIMPIKLYYLILAGICLILGIVCLFFPYHNKAVERSILK